MLDSIKKMLVYFNLYKIIHSIKTGIKTLIDKPQNVYDDYQLMFLYYFLLKANKNIKVRPLLFEKNELSFDELKNLNLEDINRLAKIIVDLNENKYSNNHSHKIFYNSSFGIKKNYPIREDLSNVSPHGYSYDKKYLKLKN